MNVIDVHLVAVVPGTAEDPEMVGLLAAAERQAIGSGFAADRDRAVTARAAVRMELSRKLGVHPRSVPLLGPELTGSGPVVQRTNIGISWSHSGRWVALALAPHWFVGVDIEAVPKKIPVKALARIGLTSLHDFVAREAAGKAIGRGLTDSWPKEVSVRLLQAPTGYLCAVATYGNDWSVNLHRCDARDPPARASATAVGVWDTTVPNRRMRDASAETLYSP